MCQKRYLNYKIYCTYEQLDMMVAKWNIRAGGQTVLKGTNLNSGKPPKNPKRIKISILIPKLWEFPIKKQAYLIGSAKHFKNSTSDGVFNHM